MITKVALPNDHVELSCHIDEVDRYELLVYNILQLSRLNRLELFMYDKISLLLLEEYLEKFDDGEFIDFEHDSDLCKKLLPGFLSRTPFAEIFETCLKLANNNIRFYSYHINHGRVCLIFFIGKYEIMLSSRNGILGMDITSSLNKMKKFYKKYPQAKYFSSYSCEWDWESLFIVETFDNTKFEFREKI